MDKKPKNLFLKISLIFIGLGVWALVLQNLGVIPTSQKVYVIGGQVESSILGSVNVNGSVDVYGTVSVEDIVDVNIHAINGYNTVTTGRGTHSVFPFGYILPVDSW